MKTIISTLCLLVLLASSVNCWEWRPFDGTFPFYEHPDTHFGTYWHFCRVKDAMNMFVGTVNEEDKVCVVAKVFTATVQVFTDFDIFYVDETVEVIQYTADISQAIPCEDQEAPDCVLGHSVVAAEVCFSVIGKVSGNKAYGVDEKQTYQSCPFVLYAHVEPPIRDSNE